MPISPSGPITATVLYRTFGSVRVALRQPEDHVEVVLAGEVGDVVGGRTGHGLRQFQVELARGRLRPARVATGGADERLLAEGDDVDALRRGLHHVRLDLGEGLLRVTPDRREVHDADDTTCSNCSYSLGIMRTSRPDGDASRMVTMYA